MNLSELTTLTVTELALSADNVLVWALIMRRLNVPQRLQRRVLAGGIAIAVIVRVLAIWAGAEAIERYWWVTPLLGGVLIWTAVKVWRGESDEDDGESRLVEWASRIGSPAVAATVGLGLVDIVFAVDSIPASFGISQHPGTIIIANGIALAALWWMYKAVSVLIDRLVYLTRGLVVVLAWLGATMVAAHWLQVPETVNLAVVVGTLTASAVLSLRAGRPAEV